MEGRGDFYGPDPVQVALATLSDDRKAGAVFVGPLGSGKTHSLQGVVQELSSSYKMSNRTTVVSAGCLRRRHVRDLLSSPTEESNRAVARRSTIAVDDLDTWNPALLRLLADAVDRRVVQLIGTIRSAAVDQVMASFRPALVPIIVNLPPWRSSDLSLHARAALDGPLHPIATAALVKFSGGNPLCLTEMLVHGRTTGQLQRRHEVWSWAPTITVPPVTFARVWNNLADLPADLVDVVTTLGACGNLPLSVMKRVHSLTVLHEAEAKGWTAAVLSSVKTEVALRRPLEGQVALAAAPLLRLRDLVTEVLQSFVAEDGAESPGMLAAAEIAQHTGVALPSEVRAAAAAAALKSHRLTLAIELASDSIEREVIAIRSAALAEQGRFQEATTVISQVEAATADDPTVSPASPTWGAALTEPTGKNQSTGTPDVGSESSLVPRLCADSWAGRHLPTVFEQGRTLIEAGLHGPVRLSCIVATSWAGLQLARVEEALQLSQLESLPRVGSRQTTMETLLAFTTGMCHAARGSILEAESVANNLCGAGVEQQWHLAFALGAFLGGQCAIAEARPQTALRRLSESDASMGVAAPLVDRDPILASLAFAYTMSGRSADFEISNRPGDTDPILAQGPRMAIELAQLARAEALLTAGQRRQALDLAKLVAERAGAEGWTFVLLLALHTVTRIQPAADTVSHLAAISQQADFALASTYARHASEVLAEDRPVLVEVAESYESMGLRWLAGETAATVLAGAERSRLKASWAVQAKRILGRIQLEDHVVLPEWWGSASERVAPLTPREQEIAEAVVRGETSTRIAARLNLSRRTVENHLQHIFRKVGVSRREDLDIAYGTVVPRDASKSRRTY